MAIVSYNNVGITALSACVPQNVIDNYPDEISDQLNKIKKVIE